MTDDLADRIEEIMSRYVFAHERLILELTENVMAKIPEQVRRNIVKLKAGGIRIALVISEAGTLLLTICRII